MVLRVFHVPLVLRVDHKLGIASPIGSLLCWHCFDPAATQRVQQDQETIRVTRRHAAKGPLSKCFKECIAHGIVADDMPAVLACQEFTPDAIALLAVRESLGVVVNDARAHTSLVQESAVPSVAVGVALLLPGLCYNRAHAALEPGFLGIVTVDADVGKLDVYAPPQLDVREDLAARLHHLRQSPEPSLHQGWDPRSVVEVAIDGPELTGGMVSLHHEAGDDSGEVPATASSQPEHVRIVLRVCGLQPTLSIDKLDLPNRVAC
mmetsp:Transcript_7569/g.21272  ORF Transcript_7569/g.21272 Transcript_7569/m.21272 type:complete len:263 (-) Transcript_7569:657-1445(-)